MGVFTYSQKYPQLYPQLYLQPFFKNETCTIFGPLPYPFQGSKALGSNTAFNT